MEVVLYPNPVLRRKAKPVVRVDKGLHALVDEMFELMYAHKGVGLAANQVGVPIRLFVANQTGKKGEGQEQVFINPVISRPRGNEEAEEGCLSLPGLNASVIRPKTVRINAFDLQGKEIDADVTGFMARIVQHETDHLDGVLFVDRLSEGTFKTIDRELFAFETDYESRQRTGSLPANEVAIKLADEWESKYC